MATMISTRPERATCPSLVTRISYQVGRPWMFEGKESFPLTGMPLRKIDFISSELALAEPVPFTVAILMTKSLMRAALDGAITSSLRYLPDPSGDLRFLRLQVTQFIFGMRP